MRIGTRDFAGALALSLCVASLSACATRPLVISRGDHTWTRPGVLRVLVDPEPSNLNPIFATDPMEVFAEKLVFDPLVTVDPKGKDVPVLAETVPTLGNGGISKDGLTIVYRLRRNVRWHDGVRFTADDVKYTWQQIMNSRNDVIDRRGYDDVAAVDVIKKYTVVFHLKRAFAPFVDTVFGESLDPYAVLPKHVLDRYSDLNKVPF